MRVPLINPVVAVIYRLDISGTWDADPPGDVATGYDPILHEPVISRVNGGRTSARVEMTPVKIPCQVEIKTLEELAMIFAGNDPRSDIALIMHRQDLKRLGLLATTGECLLKPGDRLDHLEDRTGRTVRAFAEPLYFYKVLPKSWGFGPDGYDLEIVYLQPRGAGL